MKDLISCFMIYAPIVLMCYLWIKYEKGESDEINIDEYKK